MMQAFFENNRRELAFENNASILGGNLNFGDISPRIDN